ncbi:hypothetical protein [Hyphomonas adhaerens]|uniref:hypothetical protein n=1 Tax=Hyphomonas adhaerens TaxID=81029 RepID=UPI002356310D|nr:hypothetical protein [Hyphomonas adhaerens]
MPKSGTKLIDRQSRVWTSADAKIFEQRAAEFTAKVTVSPEAALAYLKELGILTPTGKLSKKYGG